MKHLLPLLLLVTSSAWAQDLSAQRQNAQNAAEKSQVELRLDQPYAGNENPKQKVDLYLPKKRNTDKPIPVVALIHGGGWVNAQALMFDKEKKPVLKDDAVIGLLGGNYEEKHTEAVAASPVTYVTKDDPPFITFHGTSDKRVAYLHAEAIHAALQKAGVPSLLIPITNGGHGSVGHPEVIARAKIFVGKTLLGADTPIDTTPIPALPEKKK